MSFCGLIKGTSPKICILCVRVQINKRSFEPFCLWILSGFFRFFLSGGGLGLGQEGGGGMGGGGVVLTKG